MKPLSRRQVLIGGAGAAVVVVGGGIIWATQPGANEATPTPNPTALPTTSANLGTLREPSVLASTEGKLELTFTAATTEVEVGGSVVRALTYNGGLPGPTLRLRRGDRVRLNFRNELDAPTNLHTHGLVVSPEGNSDNVFVMVDPGSAWDYDYQLGTDHPPGIFWYHPHHHGNSADQLFGGLYGAIIVEDETAIPVTRERVLVVSDIGFDSLGEVRATSRAERMQGREGELVLVNGQLGATALAAPGERERWRVINACASRYLKLQLTGQKLELLGVDGGRYDEPRPFEELVLAPGNRADVIVTAVEGESVLRTLPFDRGSTGMGAPPSATGAVDLLTFTVAGDAFVVDAQVPPQSLQRDLRNEAITGERTLTLAMAQGGGMGGGMAFTIDGNEFDLHRIDTEIMSGAIEEWTIVNTSTMDHPFHLHVWPMQIVEVGGTRATTIDWQDVVPVPAKGRTVVRIAFEGLTGKTVYHCHILDHEDSGMMGIIRSS